MCQTFRDWVTRCPPEVQHTDEVYVTANAFQLGSRIAKTDNDGYIPIGFFQLWNARATGVKEYPMGAWHVGSCRHEVCPTMAATESSFIPEVVPSISNPNPRRMGQWRGRQPSPFAGGIVRGLNTSLRAPPSADFSGRLEHVPMKLTISVSPGA